MRSDRNLYSKNLIESQDEIAEMKRKFKIMNHQIEQLKEEIEAKDQVGTPPLSLSPLSHPHPPTLCILSLHYPPSHPLSPVHPSHPPTPRPRPSPSPLTRPPLPAWRPTGLRQGAHRALEGGQG